MSDAELWLWILWAVSYVAATVAVEGWSQARRERDEWRDIAEMWRKQWELK